MSCQSTGLTEEDLNHIGQVASSVPVEDFTIHGGLTHAKHTQNVDYKWMNRHVTLSECDAEIRGPLVFQV